jgi:uncharacterized membrane protein YdbT with pleckstrin-like domain
MPFRILNDKSWLSLTKDEEIIHEVNPSFWASLPTYVFAGVLVGVGVLAALYFMIAPLLLVSVVGLILGVAEEIRRRFTWYVLTTEEVYVKTGIISQYPRHARYDNIEDHEMDKTIVERIFGFADIYLATAGSDGQELLMDNVPNAQDFKNEIVSQIDIAHERMYAKSRDEAELSGGAQE